MNARDWALLELDARHLPGWKTGQTASKHLRDRSPPTDPRDLALAERIIIGVVKNHLLLMHLALHYSGRAPNQIDTLVLKILEIGLYQLRFMDRIPASAAVDEAVEQARRFGRARAAGFVNAVLRNATRQPQVHLPDANSDPQKHSSIVLSHPPELFEKLRQIMSVEDALRFCRHDNSEPPTLVRLFRGASADRLQAEGVRITPHERPGIYVIEPAKRATLGAWALAGIAQAQDATSASVVPHLELQPGQRVLDRCCGMGTKTLQIRDELGRDGTIVAIDPSAARCEALRKLLHARGIDNVLVHQVAMLRRVPELHGQVFDRILIDVPCSNSGVLARRPEARYAQDDRSIASLVELQRDILDDSAEFLATGGLMVYSTCSVWPAENEQQVQHFVSRHPDYSLAQSHTALPSFEAESTRYHDGGFVAVLRRV